MKIQSLGHVVIKVRNQQRAEAFYNGLLGIPIAARFPPLSMTFFTLGNHHDFAVAAVGDDALDAPANSPGLFHVAFKIGTRIDELREAKLQLQSAGLKVDAYDHEVSKWHEEAPRSAACVHTKIWFESEAQSWGFQHRST